MVSRKPTKPLLPPRPGAGDVAPTKPSPSPVARRVRGQAAREPAQVPRLRARRRIRLRRLLFVARLAVLGSLRKRRAAAAGPQRLRSSSPPPPPPPAVRAQSAAALLPPPTTPGRRTLFLDLDETLIHAHTASPPPAGYDFAVRPVFGGRSVTFYITKRPGVDAFLRAAAERFEVVAFTAGLPEYASLVLDGLDPDGDLFAHRLYRGACRDVDGCSGRLVKDLAATGRALDSVLIVDDNPNS
ncbi:hypothetical protein EJB05_08797, partial [Eragrostis curvula]